MRRLRSGLILVLRIKKGFVNFEADKFFQFLEDARTRGHKLRIIRQTCRLNIRKYTISQRVITEWNHLPPEAVIAKTVILSKRVINHYWFSSGVTSVAVTGSPNLLCCIL